MNNASFITGLTGEEIAQSVYEYPHAVMETHIPTGETLPPNWALQDPQDYLNGLLVTVRSVMAQSKVLPEEVIGIGVDFTSATILPVTKEELLLSAWIREVGNHRVMLQRNAHRL